MRPLREFSAQARAGIRGVLCDIDDTLTTDGVLTAEAYAAMERLQRGGFKLVPVTGRPAGWCDHIARMWPVDGVVGENGAFYFCYDRERRSMVRRFMADEAERALARRKLSAVRDRILAQVPGCAVASDQLYREADLAIDWCEDVPRLSPESLRRIVSIMQQEGLTAKVSSIHVNGWFGGYDKLSMTRRLVREQFRMELDACREQFVFVGDSPNDAPMFAHFPHSVGVANVRDFAGQLPSEPAYVTEAAAGAGFAELAQALLKARMT